MRLRDVFLPNQPRLPWRRLVLAALGVAVVVAMLGLLGESVALLPLFVGFAPTCMLVFALPEAPVSQPAAVIGGQLVAALVGVAGALVLPVHWWSIALVAGCPVAAMAVLRIIHPPAIANTVLAFVTGAGVMFLLVPVLAASTAIVAVALVWHRCTGTRYPAPGLLGGPSPRRRGEA
ncbi:HPP family protein [Leucobacter sp. VD1]|uniref:HPP family protein n=1 Tax=Leucobacter sp. VD1 TaxID=3080381 RepID=UPI003015D77D